MRNVISFVPGGGEKSAPLCSNLHCCCLIVLNVPSCRKNAGKNVTCIQSVGAQDAGRVEPKCRIIAPGGCQLLHLAACLCRVKLENYFALSLSLQSDQAEQSWWLVSTASSVRDREAVFVKLGDCHHVCDNRMQYNQ